MNDKTPIADRVYFSIDVRPIWLKYKINLSVIWK